MPLTAPSVAAARYLRHLHGDQAVRITYIGDCPASDEAIDTRISPADFLEALRDHGIDLGQQPRVFDSVIPPDRRRYLSLPGGLPTPELLWSVQRRVLVELDEDEYLPELAQYLVASDCVLLDLAPRLGCACSGAAPGVPAAAARRSVLALEPPRATQSPIDPAVNLRLSGPPAAPPAVSPAQLAEPSETRVAAAEQGAADRVLHPQPAGAVSRDVPDRGATTGRPRRRFTPTGYFRAFAAGVPQTRSGEGRILPRAYVARRHSLIAARAAGASTRPAASATAPEALAASATPVSADLAEAEHRDTEQLAIDVAPRRPEGPVPERAVVERVVADRVSVEGVVPDAALPQAKEPAVAPPEEGFGVGVSAPVVPTEVPVEITTERAADVVDARPEGAPTQPRSTAWASPEGGGVPEAGIRAPASGITPPDDLTGWPRPAEADVSPARPAAPTTPPESGAGREPPRAPPEAATSTPEARPPKVAPPGAAEAAAPQTPAPQAPPGAPVPEDHPGYAFYVALLLLAALAWSDNRR